MSDDIVKANACIAELKAALREARKELGGFSCHAFMSSSDGRVIGIDNYYLKNARRAVARIDAALTPAPAITTVDDIDAAADAPEPGDER